jgi:hypothetical protein
MNCCQILMVISLLNQLLIRIDGVRSEKIKELTTVSDSIYRLDIVVRIIVLLSEMETRGLLGLAVRPTNANPISSRSSGSEFVAILPRIASKSHGKLTRGINFSSILRRRTSLQLMILVVLHSCRAMDNSSHVILYIAATNGASCSLGLCTFSIKCGYIRGLKYFGISTGTLVFTKSTALECKAASVRPKNVSLSVHIGILNNRVNLHVRSLLDKLR